MKVYSVNIPLLKNIARNGDVRIALRAMRTSPLRAGNIARKWMFSLLGLNMMKLKANLNGILYQNYTAVLYHFKTAGDNFYNSIENRQILQ